MTSLRTSLVLHKNLAQFVQQVFPREFGYLIPGPASPPRQLIKLALLLSPIL